MLTTTTLPLTACMGSLMRQSDIWVLPLVPVLHGGGRLSTIASRLAAENWKKRVLTLRCISLKRCAWDCSLENKVSKRACTGDDMRATDMTDIYPSLCLYRERISTHTATRNSGTCSGVCTSSCCFSCLENSACSATLKPILSSAAIITVLPIVFTVSREDWASHIKQNTNLGALRRINQGLWPSKDSKKEWRSLDPEHVVRPGTLFTNAEMRLLVLISAGSSLILGVSWLVRKRARSKKIPPSSEHHNVLLGLDQHKPENIPVESVQIWNPSMHPPLLLPVHHTPYT